jgi:hypothetical protein
VTVPEALALIAAGVAAGIVSTVVSLASVVSYPALLAIGLPPLSANMTNTVSLLFTAVGAAAGSRPELTGQAARIRRLGLITAVGGGAGAALLLITPPQTFVRAAPVLIGAASLVLLAQPGQPGPGQPRQPGRPGQPRRGQPDQPGRPDPGQPGQPDPGQPRRRGRGGEGSPLLLAGVFGVAVYVGYFGAAGGILMLALLTVMLAEPLARTNALKNVIGGLANGVAAIAFALFGQVDWAAVAPLAAGFLIGGWTGPALVRRLPGRAMRVLIAVCGLAVAVKLGIAAYR